MKQEKTEMADLPYDILKLIMMFVAQSPNGVATFVRATSRLDFVLDVFHLHST